jgi:pimeloyl-ACP methyl ester carboxylesterase
MLGLFSPWHTIAAAPWTLPAGVKTLEVNGYPIAFLESGTGEPVVLLHGSGADYRQWRQQMESPPRGFRLIAISLRHYYPERWDGTGNKFSEDQHAEDLGRFIEALTVGPVFLVAHSSGGRVAVKAAQQRPMSVKKLVLMEAFSMRCCRSQRPTMENLRSRQFAKRSGRGLSKETSMEAWNFGLIETTLEPGRDGGKKIGKDHGTMPGH